MILNTMPTESNSEASYLPPVGSMSEENADVEQAGRDDAGEA